MVGFLGLAELDDYTRGLALEVVGGELADLRVENGVERVFLVDVVRLDRQGRGAISGVALQIEEYLDVGEVDVHIEQIDVAVLRNALKVLFVGLEQQRRAVHTDAARVVLDERHLGKLRRILEHNVHKRLVAVVAQIVQPIQLHHLDCLVHTLKCLEYLYMNVERRRRRRNEHLLKMLV